MVFVMLAYPERMGMADLLGMRHRLEKQKAR
jgi:hypothetical protein